MFKLKIKIAQAANILRNPIEYLKGVGPLRADMLKKELDIFTFADLLEYFPYRHIDRTRIHFIRDIRPETEFIQIKGQIIHIEVIGQGRVKRLVAQFRDASGTIELTWFQGINWVQKSLKEGVEYLVYGRAGFFQGRPQISHPEMEPVSAMAGEKNFLEPVYPSTEKLKARGLSGRAIGKLTRALLSLLSEKEVPENIPENIIGKLNLMPRFRAYHALHFPASPDQYERAAHRLKFEEFFLAQVRLGMLRQQRHRFSKGIIFDKVGEYFNGFYKNHLPFALTNAQKRVIREIRTDTARGRQMNRLLQGDVGSGKTIVALLTMLLAIDNGFQACLMAPTEILSRQHFDGISELLAGMPLELRLLTGSTKARERREILAKLESGELHFLIGTHALLEDPVKFSNLGLAVIDEQHRFGVAQRARLWAKAPIPPHVLVMTATPIPRTLAMTAYGDLDCSIIDELPPGRQPVTTVHRYDNKRHQVMDFIKHEIAKGRQAYIIFPLIEESEKLSYENLEQGYENIKAWFPEPKYWISMVHGRQPAEVKRTNMERFVKGDTNIMVSTTVIEVGVNVPNASIMVVESAEKFGLSQLHQLRGRVGRGAEKSFCILLTAPALTADARHRMDIMTSTTDGFKIAEKDLELRGPGDIEGTRQSGELNFRLANIVNDRALLETARQEAAETLENDPGLNSAENLRLSQYLQYQKGKTEWSRIS